jgi:hypothetical protein
MKNLGIILVAVVIVLSMMQKIDTESTVEADTNYNPYGVEKSSGYNPYEVERTRNTNPSFSGLYNIDRASWNHTIYFMEVDEKDWNYDDFCTDPKKNKKVGETYKNTVIPRAIRYIGRCMKDTKEVRIAMYHAGIGTVETAWKEASYSYNTDWRMYLPQSTQDYMKENEKTSWRKIK